MGVQSRAEPACPKSQDQHHELDGWVPTLYFSEIFCVYVAVANILWYPDICLKSFKHLYSWLKISVAELDILRLRNIDYICLWLI
jgi:ABC-type microcin C transport system permease subunit YejE